MAEPPAAARSSQRSARPKCTVSPGGSEPLEDVERSAYRPRALFDRFNIEVLATTDSATDTLGADERIQAEDWNGRVIPTFRPDNVVDPDKVGFRDAVERLGELAGEDTLTYRGYLAALRRRRERFVDLGATASDHGHPTAFTIELGEREAAALVQRVMTDYVHDLRPLLNRFGTEPSFTIVVFTLDESTYSRELAPLAGYYRALRLGPAWWFYDSPDGIRRYRELVTETAGFYNTAGFNDDTRAFASIPVRHDVARRIDCGYLARLVAEHRLPLDEAHETAFDLAYRLAKETYRL